MRKIFLMIILTSILFYNAAAQPESDNKPQVRGKSNQVSLNLNIPFEGYLKDISNFGIGIQYEWSKKRFGSMTSKPAKLIGFTFNIGADHYFGEKESIGMYSVKYKRTSYLHAYGGAIYNPCTGGNLSLTAGPTIELYDGNSEFGFGVNLSGGFYMSKCRNIGITPNTSLMKQGSSEAVFAGGVRLNYTF